MTQAQHDRTARLLPEGQPRYIRVYDNGGESIDRYTVVFTGSRTSQGHCWYLAMSSMPCAPNGFCQHGEHTTMIDRPTSSHLGKKISFAALPTDCQSAVVNDYKAIWRLS